MKEYYGYENLAFFGKVNASISHELKNIMAIISETAGLLGDLTDLTSTGKPIELDSLKMCTSTIIEEIERGFFTIRQMNRFAHSVDHPVEKVDLKDVLDLVTNLSAFLSYAGQVQVAIDEAENPVIYSCPFLVQTLFYQVLVNVFKHTGPDAEITVSMRKKDEDGWKIIFSGFNPTESDVFIDDIMLQIADTISAGIDFVPGAGHLELFLPHDI